MEVRHASHPEAVRGIVTDQLRRHFLIESLFRPGAVTLTYSHINRFVVGGAIFLASAAADYVHGVVLPVDCGWLAR